MNELRSYLRTRERFFRKHPLHDGHVRLFLDTYTPTLRAMWECPRCGREVRRGDASRDTAGRLKKHCGCRDGLIGPPCGVFKYGVGTASAEFKRMARVMGLKGFKQTKCDAHVLQWRAWRAKEMRRLNYERHCMSKLSADDRIQRRRDKDNRNTALLKDKYVRHLIVKSVPLLKGVELPQALIDVERMRLMIVIEITAKEKSR